MAKAQKEVQEDKPVKTSLSIKPSKMKKLKIITVYEAKNITDLVDEGIDLVIAKYEKKNGPIPVK